MKRIANLILAHFAPNESRFVGPFGGLPHGLDPMRLNTDVVTPVHIRSCSMSKTEFGMIVELRNEAP